MGLAGLKKYLAGPPGPGVRVLQRDVLYDPRRDPEGARVYEAFQQVLDDPAAAEALQNPALKPLLELAAD